MTANHGVTVTEVDTEAMAEEGLGIQDMVAETLDQTEMLEKVRAAGS